MENQPSMTSTALERATVGLFGGGCLGLFFLCIGIARILIALLSGAHMQELSSGLGSALGWAAVYSGAFAAAGAAIGVLWPLRGSVVGSFLLGYLAAGIVSVVMVHLAREPGEPRSGSHELITAVIMTLAFGTAAGWQFWRWDRKP
jgi:hypothetical protein